jgi:hypothetical protein
LTGQENISNAYKVKLNMAAKLVCRNAVLVGVRVLLKLWQARIKVEKIYYAFANSKLMKQYGESL